MQIKPSAAQAAAVVVGDVVGPPDVSRWLDVPEATLAQWRHFGKGPAYFRAGRHVRYLATDVMVWIDAQRALAQHRPA